MRIGGHMLAAAAGLCIGASSLAAVINISGGNVTMSQLVGNSFIVGDKQFHVDGYVSNTIPGSNVTVQAVNFGLSGIGFDLVGTWNDNPGDAASTGFTLSYRVEIIQPGFFITANHLQFNGFAFGPGSFATVNESVFNSTGGLLGTKLVFANGGLPSSQWELTDSLSFPPQSSLQIVKDFQLFASGVSGIASASFIRQTFTQIPSPGSAALLAVASLAAIRRRR